MAGRVAGRAFAHGAQAPWVRRVPREGARVRSLRPGAECNGRLLVAMNVRVEMISAGAGRGAGRGIQGECAVLCAMVLLWVLGCEAFARCGHLTS